jgi:hypothetical protein
MSVSSSVLGGGNCGRRIQGRRLTYTPSMKIPKHIPSLWFPKSEWFPCGFRQMRSERPQSVVLITTSTVPRPVARSSKGATTVVTRSARQLAISVFVPRWPTGRCWRRSSHQPRRKYHLMISLLSELLLRLLCARRILGPPHPTSFRPVASEPASGSLLETCYYSPCRTQASPSRDVVAQLPQPFCAAFRLRLGCRLCLAVAAAATVILVCCARLHQLMCVSYSACQWSLVDGNILELMDLRCNSVLRWSAKRISRIQSITCRGSSSSSVRCTPRTLLMDASRPSL